MHKITDDILFQFECAKIMGASSKVIFIPDELNELILNELKQESLEAIPYNGVSLKNHKVYEIYC